MSGILVPIRPAGDRPDPLALEALAAARPLGDPVALWLTDTTAPAAELAEHGAVRVLRVPLPAEQAPLAAAQAAGVLAAIEVCSPDLVLLGSSHAARDIAGRVAALTGSGVVTGVRSIERAGDGFETNGEVLGGSWLVRSRIQTPLGIVTLAPGAAEPHAAPVPEPAVEDLPVPPNRGTVRLIAREQAAASTRPELAAARAVVVGGRGTDGDFGPVESLADALGGAVGATRVAVDEGWAEHRLQVGQTGAQIAPALYVGLGVSGAIHHTSGMRSSGTIVAINTDASAPIFEIADAGVVGDLKDLTPRLIEALRSRLG